MLWIVEVSLEFFSYSLIWGHARVQVNERWSIETREKGWLLVSGTILHFYVPRYGRRLIFKIQYVNNRSCLHFSYITLPKRWWDILDMNLDTIANSHVFLFNNSKRNFLQKFYVLFFSGPEGQRSLSCYRFCKCFRSAITMQSFVSFVQKYHSIYLLIYR